MGSVREEIYEQSMEKERGRSHARLRTLRWGLLTCKLMDDINGDFNFNNDAQTGGY